MVNSTNLLFSTDKRCITLWVVMEKVLLVAQSLSKTELDEILIYSGMGIDPRRFSFWNSDARLFFSDMWGGKPQMPASTRKVLEKELNERYGIEKRGVARNSN